ncbi:MAG: hypothetical protein Q9215_007834 [Flavoplaca cf. flavocitrina]
MPEEKRIEKWRPNMLGTRYHVADQMFWNDGDTEPLEDDNSKTMRILVCGNAGAGKSTLVKRVFGIDPDDKEVTDTSHRSRGRHDVRDEIRHKYRRHLIIHDSGGFEAGDESQMQAVGQFVKERSMMPNIEDRLHVIWFCLDMSSAQTTQTTIESLFKAVSVNVVEVPIILIATKIDSFGGIRREAAREMIEPILHKASPKELIQLDKLYTKRARYDIFMRMELIKKEMLSLDWGHFDACVAVARDDPKSIEDLNKITMQNVKDEKLRLLYIATQTASMNLKIDAAVKEVMKVYTDVLGTSSTAGLVVPIVSSKMRAASGMLVCSAIVQCFGLPSVSTQTVVEIMKNTIWEDAGDNLVPVGVVAGIGIGLFGAPFFLAGGAMNFQMAVPATARLMLSLAGDLILILLRAFRITTTRCVGQPGEKDVALAARYYRAISADVHKAIFELVPKRNLLKSFRYEKVQMGLKRIVEKFKEQVVKDLRLDRQSRADTESFANDHEAIDKEIDEARDVLSGSS